MLIQLFYSSGGRSHPVITFDTNEITTIQQLEQLYIIKFKNGGDFTLNIVHRKQIESLDKFVLNGLLDKTNKRMVVLKFVKTGSDADCIEEQKVHKEQA